jgi:hypothetical protein
LIERPITPATLISGCDEVGTGGEVEPHTKIVEELPQVKREAVQLMRQAIGAPMCSSTTGGRKRAANG